MNVVRTVAAMRAESERSSNWDVGFVPTMGALHDGHVSLIRTARRASPLVVMSLFVNPLQFGPREDFDRYPRDEARDLAIAEAEGVDVAFVPSTDEMYGGSPAVTVRVGDLGDRFEGRSRPGHFDGVATVVAKLFNVVQPTRAYFGRKDAQQLAVIKRMVDDLSFPVTVVPCETVRDTDGLALSSRNAYLSPDERDAATTLWRALQAGKAAVDAGGDAAAAATATEKVLTAHPLVEADYAAAVDPDSFGPPAPDGPVLLIVAARVGATRLIDNLLVRNGGR